MEKLENAATGKNRSSIRVAAFLASVRFSAKTRAFLPIFTGDRGMGATYFCGSTRSPRVNAKNPAETNFKTPFPSRAGLLCKAAEAETIYNSVFRWCSSSQTAIFARIFGSGRDAGTRDNRSQNPI